ncbi:HNH endonuclease signature motif containing protein [Glycomyces sp. NRRL B-16210]|uniref:HNH endonuclease signature motif containing protein n=1 Tax=Glycomyces sp. NRRL B-16210 TaxID=1463821 RepID=UPI0004BFB49A|nr:HNH endonuclease signature motif containing protein [Glycomyces sp. NRRL B-16210]
MSDKSENQYGSDRDAEAAFLRSQIESLAAQSRAREAHTLEAVIAYTSAGHHKACDGFSGIRGWIMECFDFNASCAGQMASIARLAPKFKRLTAAALSGAARIDAIAYAMRRLEREGLAVYSRVPYPEPVESPYDPSVHCATPEELIREYCVHSLRSELAEHFDRVCAELFDRQALLDEMSQQSLAWFEVNERPDGMWDVDGRVTADTGRLLSNALKTAVAPPRQEDADEDGLLPPAANRNAEALHQMAAAYGTDPRAPKRHGHTATLNLTCDLATLRGEKTGRLPMLDGRPVSVSKARRLACEAGVIPSVFDYSTGEAIELGRAKRLPNVALRHKLELEQPGGCAWSGCRAPVAWTEAHHLEHWADGGATVAENLILLCRFHHSRIHTGKWSIEKTGPGRASIVHTASGASDAEWEEEKDLPNGHDYAEWSPTFKRELTDYATWYAEKSMDAAIAKARAKFQVVDEAARTGEPERVLVSAVAETSSDTGESGPRVLFSEDPGPPPFLGCLSGRLLRGSAPSRPRKPDSREGSGPSACPPPVSCLAEPWNPLCHRQSPPRTQPLVAAFSKSDRGLSGSPKRQVPESLPSLPL